MNEQQRTLALKEILPLKDAMTEVLAKANAFRPPLQKHTANGMQEVGDLKIAVAQLSFTASDAKLENLTREFLQSCQEMTSTWHAARQQITRDDYGPENDQIKAQFLNHHNGHLLVQKIQKLYVDLSQHLDAMLA